MNRHFLLILIFVLPFFEANAQNEKTYEQQWKLVDSLINKMNQPKTAIKFVDKIYRQARTERNVDQSVKALVYKLSLSGTTKDERPSSVVEMIDSVQLHPINPLENSLLWCLKAQFYSQYLQDNQWKIQNRKDTFATKESDWATWTTRDFEWHIYHSYQKALSDSIELQNAKVQQYPALVLGKDYKLRPTLYDLVLQIAIYHYGANIDRYSPKNGYQLNEKALGTLPSFLAYNAASSDTLSNDRIALELYQKVLRFHQKQDNIDALLDANNERIAWAYRNISSNIISKDSLYVNTLRNTISQYPNNPISLQSAYMVAAYYNGLSQKYVDNKKNTANRYKRITALSYINQYLPKDTVKTEGWLNLAILKNEIETSKVLEAKMESVNIPNKPMLAWVNSYLVKKLYLKVVAVKPSDYKVNNLDSMLKVRPAVQEFTQDLPERGDYQAFSTEIKVDGLPIGSYWLVISEDKEFTKSHVGVPIKVSQLGYFNAQGDGFVVDRETGAPIADVRMKVRDDSYKNLDKKNSQLVSDKNGHFILRTLKKDNNNWYYLSAVLYKGIDSLPITINQLNNLVSVSSKEDALDEEDIADNQEDNVQARYVSDRNIYRPGQKIYFKTYFATKDDDDLPFHIWKRNKEITMFLSDANNQRIDSLKLKQDDYGTVNGSFIIPNGKLTGRYFLSDDWSNEDMYFQVEEYKRPTFFVETDSVKQTYRLGDSVAVSVTAITYSGAKVSGAKVKVHVSRRTRFTYYWHRPSSYNYNTADILDTIVETDNQGKFSFLFKAVPDETIDSTTLPIFQYQCTVDVTDANGETHNTEKQVAIGYQSVELHWNVGNDAKVKSLDALKISTKNTNGIAVPTSVHISIEPVVNPGWLLRNKLWDQPDIKVIDSITYKKYFPHDIYGKEDDKEYWAKSAAIYDKQIASDSSLDFNTSAANGWYYLEATAVSPEGKPLKDFCYVQLVKDGNVVNDQYLQGNANNYVASVGDTVNQFVATAADQLQVVEMTDSKKGNQFRYLTMEKGIQKYTTIITDLEQYPLNHSFATYKDNRFYSQTLRITTQPKTETLDVKIKTFRDKTEPGSKEKWSVQVNKNDTLVHAQLLSTMYDASLDQIKAGDWYYGFPQVNIDRNMGDFNSNSTTSDYSRDLSFINYFYPNYNKSYPVFFFDKNAPIGTFNQMGFVGGSLTDDVVVVGYGTRKRAFTAAATSVVSRSAELAKVDVNKFTPPIIIRGNSSIDNRNNPLILIDGQVFSGELNAVSPEDIESMNVLKDASATALYGARGTNGVILITTKSQKYGKLTAPALRSNFSETSFFFPDLTADKDGNYWVEFQMPDAVTRWRWRNLAMDKDLRFGYTERTVTSQKTLMVQPNMPRFLRAGDALDLSMKVSNTGAKALNGTGYIQLLDMDSTIVGWQKINQQTFEVGADNSTVVHFKLDIPENYSGPLYVKTWAEGGNYSDGEMHEVAVLSRKTLVMDSKPFELKGDTVVHLSLDKLLESKDSKTIDNQSLVLQVATNPVWYVVQALPYLAYYNYECSEQLFNRMYAGFLAGKITGEYPQIQKVLQQWENDPEALKSNLQKNEALKQTVLEETPWVNAAQSEAAKKRQLALLYNKDSTEAILTRNFEKLAQRQLTNGSFSWYDGNYGDRYITQYIVTQYAKLLAMNAVSTDWKSKLNPIVNKAQQWLSEQIAKDYASLIKSKARLTDNNTFNTQLEYLYGTSQLSPNHKWTTAESYYFNQTKKYWNSFSNVQKAWIADLHFRTDRIFAINTVIKSLLENAVESKEAGLYWKAPINYWWSYGSPIESHSQIMTIIENIAEKDKNNSLKADVQEMQHWLIRNKQTNYWYNTKATAEACYATLMANKKWINADPKLIVKLGDSAVTLGVKEVGTGFTEVSISKQSIKPSMGNVEITVSKNPGYVYGGIYWQYLENIDKVTVEKGPLSLTKKLYKEVIANGERSWQEIKPTDSLSVGEKILTRLTISSERDLQYVHLKDLRPSDTEPTESLSGYNYNNGMSYYQSVKDISNNYFFNSISKGFHVLEYTMNITHSGIFASGLASIQCMYAPEFASHSEGRVLIVK